MIRKIKELAPLICARVKAAAEKPSSEFKRLKNDPARG